MRNICLNNIRYKDNSFLGYTTYQAKAITISRIVNKRYTTLNTSKSSKIISPKRLIISLFLSIQKYPLSLHTLQPEDKGEVLEWLKRHAWKACIPLKGIESSNLFLSA